jgi:hypothetical protein
MSKSVLACYLEVRIRKHCQVCFHPRMHIALHLTAIPDENIMGSLIRIRRFKQLASIKASTCGL